MRFTTVRLNRMPTNKRILNIPMDDVLIEHIKRLAASQGESAAEVARTKLAELLLESEKLDTGPRESDDPNPQGCPATTTPCRLPNHGDAEARIERELAPRLRRKIAPRASDEGPHEYIARFWASDALERDHFVDQQAAMGWGEDES